VFRRAAPLLLALAACDQDRLREGMSDVHLHPMGYAVEVTFDLAIAKPLADWESIGLLAACQVGTHRYVDVLPILLGDLPPRIGEKPFVYYGERNHRRVTTFAPGRLPGKATLCELALFRRDYRGPGTEVEIDRVCAADEVRPGPCPPNPAHPPVSGPPLTVDELTVSIENRSGHFPEALLVEAVVTAQADMKPDAALHFVVTCGSQTDDTYDIELERLRAGESLIEGSRKFRNHPPPPSVPCTITYALAETSRDPGVPFATFCYVGGRTTRGACPP
jgi:hypothetical protein